MPAKLPGAVWDLQAVTMGEQAQRGNVLLGRLIAEVAAGFSMAVDCMSA
jgi:hypothetical protein